MANRRGKGRSSNVFPLLGSKITVEMITAMKLKDTFSWEEKLYLYIKFHSSSIHKSQKVERTQMFINRWLNQQTVVCPHNGVVLSHQKKLSTIRPASWVNLDQDAKWKKPDTMAPFCVTAFTWSVQNRQINRDSMWLSGAAGKGGMRSNPLWVWRFHLGWWKYSQTRQRWWLHRILNVLNAP